MKWKDEFKKFGDGPIIFKTCTDEEWEREFYSGYGEPNGVPFLAWTEEWIYFPVVYDGSEWMDRVPRNPRAIPRKDLAHVGGCG